MTSTLATAKTTAETAAPMRKTAPATDSAAPTAPAFYLLGGKTLVNELSFIVVTHALILRRLYNNPKVNSSSLGVRMKDFNHLWVR